MKYDDIDLNRCSVVSHRNCLANASIGYWLQIGISFSLVKITFTVYSRDVYFTDYLDY